MKKRLLRLFAPQPTLLDEEILDIQTLYLFRIKLLEAILLTAALVGLGTWLLEYTEILPGDRLYTPMVLVYSLVNAIGYLILKYSTTDRYLFAMHLCIFSALLTFSVMSTSLLYDEFRFIWFFLLSFAAFMLGGKWYGMTVSFLILGILYTEFFMKDLHFSGFGLFSFTTSLLTFNAFSLIFLNKIEQDSLTMRTHIHAEVEKRKAQESIVEKIQKEDITDLKEGYFWDTKRKTLSHENQTIALTQKEQQLLALLLKNTNHCVTFEDIQVVLWEEKYDEEISIPSVKVQVTKLRKKLPKGCIKNVYGCGYIFHS